MNRRSWLKNNTWTRQRQEP